MDADIVVLALGMEEGPPLPWMEYDHRLGMEEGAPLRWMEYDHALGMEEGAPLRWMKVDHALGMEESAPLPWMEADIAVHAKGARHGQNCPMGGSYKCDETKYLI